MSDLETPNMPDAPDPAEAEARLIGWRPREEYTGPEERWKTAEEFLEEGKHINGFLRKDLDKLRSELARRDASLAEMKQAIQEFSAHHEKTVKAEYERAVRDLRAARKQALRENDGETVVQLEEQLEALGPPPTPRRPTQPAPNLAQDPVWVDWLGENDWFQKDPKRRGLANGYSEILRAEQPELVGRPFLDEVTRRVQADFPELFGQARSRPQQVLTGGRGSAAPSGRKSYADLPAEAREACDKFVRLGLVKSKEDYVKDYFGVA